MICHIMSDYPASVECISDDSGLTASTCLIFHTQNRICKVDMIHSRHSTAYEQFVSIFTKDRCIDIGRIKAIDGTSFDDRYKDSYEIQMNEFTRLIEYNKNSYNIPLEHSIQIERILESCEKSCDRGEIQIMMERLV